MTKNDQNSIVQPFWNFQLRRSKIYDNGSLTIQINILNNKTDINKDFTKTITIRDQTATIVTDQSPYPKNQPL